MPGRGMETESVMIMMRLDLIGILSICRAGAATR